MPIEWLNSLILLSSNGQLFDSARQWVERLDAGTSGEGSSGINIYYVQNDKASNLKTILVGAPVFLPP